MGRPKSMEETNPRSRHSGKTLNIAAHVRRRFSIRADRSTLLAERARTVDLRAERASRADLLAERARVKQDSGNRQ